MMRSIRALPVAALFAAAVSSAQFCPGVTPWVFSDVPAGDPFCGYITWMAQSGVTLGCRTIDATHRLYCPADFVRRDQMAAFLGRLDAFQFPTTCASGQVLKWDGSAWDCANDAVGGGGGAGTVTSVVPGTGLTASPSPITASGTLFVATSYRLPQSCATNFVAKWNGTHWVCANDIDTNSGGTVTSLTAGSGIVLAPNPIVGSGTVAVDATYVQRRVSASCSVGSSIRAIAADGSVTCEPDSGADNAFVQGGNAFGATAVLGTTDTRPLDVQVAGRRALRIEPGHSSDVPPNIYAGYVDNAIDPSYSGQTIAGGGGAGSTCYIAWLGGSRSCQNRTANQHATIGGGFANVASGYASTVAGGYGNEASGRGATVVGGGTYGTGTGFSRAGNLASGSASTVLGGMENVAGGAFSIAAGVGSEAHGMYSLAIGHRAKALGNGAFSFADANPFDFSSNSVNVFRVRATGGVRFVTDIDAAGSTVWSCLATAGAGWSCSSDVNQKQNLARLDGRDVLDRLASLPVYAWNPKGRNAQVRHFGPTAQDFRAAFGLGDDDTLIGTQDADGVALAAIQGLHALLRERDATIARQGEALARVQAELDELRTAVGRLLATAARR